MKFFNKKRFEILKGKRLSKYLLYATGEIILVVLGILIALWINNWNKAKQLEVTNKNLQEKVLQQLDNDMTSVDDFSKKLYKLDQYYLKVLERKYDKSVVDETRVIYTTLFEVKDLGLTTKNMNWIDTAELDNSLASKELINLSSIYKLYFKNIEDIETIIYKKLTSNFEYLEATQPWYTDLITDFKCNDDCQNYLLYNPEHQARIASLRLLYTYNYGEIVKNFYKELKGAKIDLETIYNTAK